MEILLLLLLFGWLGKGTTKAVLCGGKRKKRRRTNWDRLSYSQKSWLHDQNNGR